MFPEENKEDYVLYVEDFSLNYTVSGKKVRALKNVSFALKEHESIGIVGESGCGKSTLAMAITHVLPTNTEITGGRVYFKGKVIADSDTGASFSLRPSRKQTKIEKSLTTMRWSGISIVFQGALDSLNPLLTVRTQLTDIFVYKKRMSKEEANTESLELLKTMGLEEWVLDAYPHQLSGGMKQRVIIAMAMTLHPSLIIADEPTTSLDVITEYRIIEELQKLREKYRISIISISHDISLVSHLSDRIMVMYAGKLVEKIPGNRFDGVQHPYTAMLLGSMPSLVNTSRKVLSIRGAPPSLMGEIQGCSFYERCNFAHELCREDGADKERVLDGGRIVRCCVLPLTVEKPQQTRDQEWGKISSENVFTGDPILTVKELRKTFAKRTGLKGRKLLNSSSEGEIVAVDNVDLTLFRGESVGLVGETGSGKTTISRIIGLLDTPTSGTINIEGEDIKFKDPRKMTKYRTQIQTIFQDPFQSINPRHNVFKIVSEPLIVNNVTRDINELTEKVKETLKTVGLTPSEDYVNKYPHQMSGGQRQRVAIARSLVLEPEIVIADEPISMLDVSLRAGILNLLNEMQKGRQLTLFYITHDIASARYVSNRIIVMYKGQIVEQGNSEDVIKTPSHPYTIALVLASIGVEGDLGNVLGNRIFAELATEGEDSCKFAPRCPIAKNRCRTEAPPLIEVSQGHYSRCHFGGDVNSIISGEERSEDGEAIKRVFGQVLAQLS